MSSRLVMQSAMNALNPVLTIGAQFRDAIAAHEPVTEQEARNRQRRRSVRSASTPSTSTATRTSSVAGCGSARWLRWRSS